MGQSVFGTQVDLFGPSSPMNCACGMGLGSTGSGLPPSVDVSQVIFTRFNTVTGQNAVVTEMLALSLSSLASQALAAAPEQLFPGSTWFGFSGQIQPFTPPQLGPDEVFMMNFVVDFDPADLPALNGLPVQFAAGVGDPRDGLPDFEDPVHPVTFFGPDAVPPCVPTDTLLCLNDGRFQVAVDWRSATRPLGPAKVVGCLSDDSGILRFLDPDNWEFLVKLLRGCDINQKFWVFYSATTNVEFTLTVTDTQAVPPRIKQYTNPLGMPAPPVQDTSAFATCP